eukprot:IDg5814t1
MNTFRVEHQGVRHEAGRRELRRRGGSFSRLLSFPETLIRPISPSALEERAVVRDRHYSDFKMAMNAKKPSQKAVVEMLMTKTKEERRDVHGRSGQVIRRNVPSVFYKCPKENDCTEGGEIHFQKGKGFTNGYSHLKSCLAGGDEAHLIELFHHAVRSSMNTGTLSGFRVTIASRLNAREKAMYSWLRLLILKNLPLSAVDDKEFRDFCKHDSVFCLKTIKATKLKLVEIVEEKIRDEMKKTKGAIMYDGWTDNGVHYVGIYVVYNRSFEVYGDGVLETETELAITLLSVSPMAAACDTETSSTIEAAKFCAVTHVRHFEDVFIFFHVNVHEWVICQIADNCSANKCIADLMDIPHVSCNSHKLHLEVKNMIGANSKLFNTVNSIQKTMTSCKNGLKNSALLRNISDLAPVLNNETRWTSTHNMLQRFNRIRESLLSVAADPDSTLTMNRSISFKSDAELFGKHFREINVVAVALQKKLLSLSDAKLMLDELRDAVRGGRDDISSPLFQCTLGDSWISPDASIIHSKHFENGVSKIQRNLSHQLTREEKEACQSLKIDTDLSSTSGMETESQSTTGSLMASRINRLKRKRITQEEEYMNCNFILGSVAEIERLWSIAGKIRAVDRKLMSHIVFDAILFLKMNQRFWDELTVKEAMCRLQSDRVKQRLQEDENHGSLD